MILGRPRQQPNPITGQAYLASTKRGCYGHPGRVTKYVRQVTSVDERILHIRLELKCRMKIKVAVSAPHGDNALEDKEWLHHKLDSVVGRCPAGNVLVTLGDFKVETISDRAEYESCIGPHGLRPRNVKSLLHLDFEKSKGLWNGGSWFQRSFSRRFSRSSKTGRVKNKIDHILVST